MQLIELVKINELLSILSGRLSATLNRHLNRKFKAAGLEITTEQWLVLVCLWNKDKLTQQAISEQTFKDKASITRLLDTLSRHDLIERHSEPSDRRINLIHLTEKGKSLKNRLWQLSRNLSNRPLPVSHLRNFFFKRNNH